LAGANLFFKLLASIVIAFVVIVIAGLSGLSFHVRPAGFNDHKLSVTPEVLQRLRDLQSERKFGPDSTTFYPGAMSENERSRAQEAVDSTIRFLIAELAEHPQRSTVLRAMKAVMVFLTAGSFRRNS
jgi:hypothetical protein